MRWLIPLLFLSSLYASELKIDADSACGGSCIEKKKARGCCKLKYPSGGFDFVMSSEEDCKNSRYFDKFTSENDALCFEWKEDEILKTW